MDEFAMASVAAKMGIDTAANLFRRSPSKEKGEISVGLAVGYFFNFLDPISRTIESDEFRVKNDDSGDECFFESDNVEVQVIVPAKLDVQAFDVCKRKYKNLYKGKIYLNSQSRYHGFNYHIVDLPKGKKLSIIDLARPVMAVKHYYENIKKITTTDESCEEWRRIQKMEIAAFKHTLEMLQKQGYGTLVNKLYFQDVA